DGYSAPTLIEAGGARQLLIWSGESLNSLDPQTGKPYWSVPLAPSYGMAIMAPRKLGEYLFAGGNGAKSVLLKLAADKPAVTEVWRGTRQTSVAPINMTPFLDAGVIYGVDQPGQLVAAEVETGKRLWETKQPVRGDKGRSDCGTAFLVK